MEQNKLLIGLGSRAQIGKDYAALHLKEFFDVERVSFADSLKQSLEPLFKQHNLNLEEILASPALKNTVRPLLVTYAQTMRSFNPDIWIDAALNNHPFNHQVTIITDVRFPNEYERIKKLGGYYVDITTNVLPANETEAHYSPILGDLADFKIQNNFDGNFIPDMISLINRLLYEQGTDQKPHVLR